MSEAWKKKGVSSKSARVEIGALKCVEENNKSARYLLIYHLLHVFCANSIITRKYIYVRVERYNYRLYILTNPNSVLSHLD